MNVLGKEKQGAIITLLSNEISQSEISRKTRIDRKTVRKYGREAGLIAPGGCRSKSPPVEGVATGYECGGHENPHPWPPGRDGVGSAVAKSACEPHREWIEDQVGLGRNAVSIYQDLVEQHGFTHRYGSVKRFVRRLRVNDPDRFDRLEFLPGEEAQVDYGLGAPTKTAQGKYKRPRLFVMTLKYSGRCFRKVVWNSSKEMWARLHEEAFRYFGGCPQYVVLDNLKEGVIKPDLYEPELNPLYAEVLSHYCVVADPARVGDANRKGSVENAVKYTQDTGLKGRRFETVEAQNEWLQHWEETWASKRIHGRTKCQVQQRYLEEKEYLKPLPLEGFRYFESGTRTVWDDGCIQVKHAYYWAGPAPIGSEVSIRIYANELEILDHRTMEVIQRHALSNRPGSVTIEESQRIFNPSRRTDALLEKAKRIGPNTHGLCQQWFEEQGRPAQRRIYGVVNLVRHLQAAHIEKAAAVCAEKQIQNFAALKRIAKAESEKTEATEEETGISQTHRLIREGNAYKEFWDRHSEGRETPDCVLRKGRLPLVWEHADWHRVVEVFALEVDRRKQKDGIEIWVCSPFTGERNASLRMNLRANIYMDFSSGSGGGIFQFCSKLLAHHGEAKTDFEVGCWMVEQGISAIPSSSVKAAAREFTANPPAKANRPIPVDLRRWLNPDHPVLRQRGVSNTTCTYLGCGFLPEMKKKGSPLNGRIVFQVRGMPQPGRVDAPILTHVGRALHHEQEQQNGKYWCYPFQKGLELYNQDHLVLDSRARRQTADCGLILVEGFFDVAVLIEAGCLNVAALMGIGLTTAQIRKLKELQQMIGFPYITLFLDRDPQGQAASHTIEFQLSSAGFEVRPFSWPRTPETELPLTAKDPAELGPQALRILRQQTRI